jgi:uncharacterized membrane protein YgaE (UPF0421/DUF939 family)
VIAARRLRRPLPVVLSVTVGAAVAAAFVVVFSGDLISIF